MCEVRRGTAAVLLAVIIPLSQHATAETLDDTGLWLAAFGNGKFKSLEDDSKVRWWFDTHYRLRDDTDGFNQSIVRPGVGYAFADEQALWVGYGWIRTSPILGGEFDEHRIWQQWTATPSYGDWRFLHRSRFEQRLVDTGDDTGLRWRQLARAQKILTNCPQWSLVAWDEIFFNLNDTDWGARAGLDQNRAFLGVGFKRRPEASGRIEIGYLNQYVNRQGSVDGMNHILSINYFF